MASLSAGRALTYRLTGRLVQNEQQPGLPWTGPTLVVAARKAQIALSQGTDRACSAEAQNREQALDARVHAG
eukprot:6208925-Pleurochrysis_carterae.AAC.2